MSIICCALNVLTGNSMESGIIITADGYILAGQHIVVIAKTLTVLLNDDSIYEASMIVSRNAVAYFLAITLYKAKITNK